MVDSGALLRYKTGTLQKCDEAAGAMARISRHPPETMAAAEALVRRTGRSLGDIAAELGVSALTVRRWSRRLGWRARLRPEPAWSAARTASLGRLYHNPAVDLRDLEAVLAARRSDARDLLRVQGLTQRRRAARGASLAGPALRAALRGHVARQIARFDAGLREEAGIADTARVLRDLGGLKRILDELDPGPEPGAGDRHGTRGTETGGPALDLAALDLAALDLPALDLPALRAEIARRYVAFAGERADPGLPGEPAAAPPAGAAA